MRIPVLYVWSKSGSCQEKNGVSSISLVRKVLVLEKVGISRNLSVSPGKEYTCMILSYHIRTDFAKLPEVSSTSCLGALTTDFRVAFNRHGDIRIGGEFKKKPILDLHHLTN